MPHFSALSDATGAQFLARLALGQATVTEVAKPFKMTRLQSRST